VVERLQAVRNGQENEAKEALAESYVPWNGDVRFSRIEVVNRSLLPPTVIVQQVIESLDLPTLVQRWGDPARRCSNLDSMLRHAREYEEIAIDSGQAATLSGFILYIEGLESEQRDVRFPPQGHDAVTLMTYHSAKGLEWPVVVLSGLNSDRSPNMWSPAVTGGGQQDKSPLEGRILRSWTWPFGVNDGQFGGLRSGSGLEDDALLSPEGQDRSSRETAENLRLLYVGCTRAKQKLVFAHRRDKYAWLGQLSAVDSILDCNLGDGEHPLKGIDTTLVVRSLTADMADDCRFPSKQSERWLALPLRTTPAEARLRFHSPSQAAIGTDGASFEIQELPGPTHFPTGAGEELYAAIGDAVHSYLAAIPSIHSLSTQQKSEVAERCLAAFSVTGILSPSALVTAGDRFHQWVETQFPGARWHVEASVVGARAEGGEWSGAVDLLLECPDGGVVVIDHKSAPIQRKHCAAKAVQFAGQLLAYTEVLTSNGVTIASRFIHFPLAGVIARLT